MENNHKQLTKEELSKLSSRDILLTHKRIERQEEIPVSMVVREGSLIDTQHAENLADSMMGERKQISPTTVRARLLDDQVVYDVIDGFHRTEAKSIIQERTRKPETLKTIVLYDCSDEELFDLRVLAANSVKSIKFARMAEWMKQSFLSTTWENKRIGDLARNDKITLSQVFSLAQFNTTGESKNLKAKEVKELKGWAAKKSKQWGKAISSLMTEMKIVEQSAPDLVQKVRNTGGGKDGKGVLTKARLHAISSNIPTEWDLQRTFAKLAVDKNILTDDLDFLTTAYSKARILKDQSTMDTILNNPESLLNPSTKAELSRKMGIEGKKIRPGARKVTEHTTQKYNETSDQNETLLKNNIIEITHAFYNQAIERLGNDVQILFLPDGVLSLTLKDSILHNNGTSIELDQKEKEFMLYFYLLDGVTLTDKFLTTVSKNVNGLSTEQTVLELKKKLSIITQGSSDEMFKISTHEYSWGGSY